jgi:S-formylglutathione hydrolase FrmB
VRPTRAIAAFGLAFAVSAASGAATAAPQTSASVVSDGYGIHVTAEHQIDPRLQAVTVTTSALPGPANIRVLLPADYATHPTRRYPVLYLLHGTSGGASDWTTMGDAERTTAADRRHAGHRPR